MRHIIIVVGLLFLFNFTHAQSPETKILKGEEIFGENITILQRFATVVFDEDAIRVFDISTETWQSFLLPMDIDTILYHEQLLDGTILLSSDLPIVYENLQHRFLVAESTRIFNPADGTFSFPHSICGYVQDTPDNGHWIVSNFFEDGQYRLCHTSTGEINSVLPEELQSPHITHCLTTDSYNLYFHVEENTVVLADCPTDYNIHVYRFYSYQIEDDTFIDLGQLEVDTLASILWSIGSVNDNHIYVTFGDINTTIYKADLTQSNSIHQIAYLQDGFPTFESDPPIYIFFDAEDGFLKKIDLQTEDILPILNSQIQFEGRVPTLMRVHALSANDRYIVLGYYANWQNHTNIVDIVTQETIFTWNRSSQELVEVIWLSPTSAILYLNKSGQNGGTVGWDVYRVNIAESVETEHIAFIEYDTIYHLIIDALHSPDNRYIQMQRTNTEFQLYDTITNVFIPVLSINETFSPFEIRWLDGDEMLVEVGANRWHIQINDLTETDT